MQNKVVVIYRNDEVAHAAVNALLQDGFSFDQIYISSPTDNEQVRYYDRIGENALLPQLDSELGRFYRSIADMDNVPETTGLYTRALKDGYVIVSVDTDSYRNAMQAAKTMCRFETLGIGSFSARPECVFDTEKDTVIPAVSETGVFVLGTYPEPENPDNAQKASDNRQQSRRQWRWLSRQAIEHAMERAGKNLVQAAGSASDMVEKVFDKTSGTLKKASVSIREMFDQDSRTPASRGEDKAFHSHWKSRYLSLGIPYDECRAAYRYGVLLAGNDKKNMSCSWDEIEPVAHAGWERHYHDHGKSWEIKRDAIRFGWEHAMNGH